MNKYLCMNPECYVSMMALANPIVCGRCGCSGMRLHEDATAAFSGIPSDVPSALYSMRLTDDQIRDEVDEGMIKLLNYLRRGDEDVVT
jgi:hypothetical protein